jgi:hypothetical protein
MLGSLCIQVVYGDIEVRSGRAEWTLTARASYFARARQDHIEMALAVVATILLQHQVLSIMMQSHEHDRERHLLSTTLSGP